MLINRHVYHFEKNPRGNLFSFVKAFFCDSVIYTLKMCFQQIQTEAPWLLSHTVHTPSK